MVNEKEKSNIPTEDKDEYTGVKAALYVQAIVEQHRKEQRKPGYRVKRFFRQVKERTLKTVQNFNDWIAIKFYYILVVGLVILFALLSQ